MSTVLNCIANANNLARIASASRFHTLSTWRYNVTLGEQLEVLVVWLSQGGQRATKGLLLLVVLLSCLCGGCASHPWKMQMTIATDANNNSPVLISVVLPKSQPLFKKLLDMTAKQWFTQREQLLRDHRRELEETYFEFIPGQQVPDINRKVSSSVSQGILFVNYQTPGSHRYTFDTNQALKISFAQQSVNLSQ